MDQEIDGRPAESMTVTAACGHEVTFTVRRDRPMAARVEKHRGRPCGPCRVAANDARVAAGWVGPAKVKKGSEVKHLPAGTLVAFRLGADGRWTGDLQAGDFRASEQGTGLMGLINKLAKAYLRGQNVAVSGSKQT